MEELFVACAHKEGDIQTKTKTNDDDWGGRGEDKSTSSCDWRSYIQSLPLWQLHDDVFTQWVDVPSR